MRRYLLRRRSKDIDKVESRFQDGLTLVKDLDKKEFERFIKGLTLGWQGYDCMRRVQTIDEKEVEDITNAEKILERESGRDK